MSWFMTKLVRFYGNIQIRSVLLSGQDILELNELGVTLCPLLHSIYRNFQRICHCGPGGGER